MAEYDISGDRKPLYSGIIKTNKVYNMTNVGRNPKVWRW